MRHLLLVGFVVLVLGVSGLIIQNVTFTQTTHVVDVGPLQIRAEEQRSVPIPTLAGIGAVIAGLGMIFASRRYS